MEASAIPGYFYATIGDSERVVPFMQFNVYHGTSDLSHEACLKQGGLPMRGNDIDLIRHAEPPPERLALSAFIGTVPFPRAPGYDAGAVYWAKEGGWVYHIHSWPGYDLNSVLEGRIPDGMGGYRGLKHCGEQEIAIPAAVPLSSIQRVGIVERLRGGLAVKWN